MQNCHIEIPNLPQNSVKLLLIDNRVSIGISNKLIDRGIDLIRTVGCNELYEAIRWHPDMVIQHLGGKNIVIAPNVIEYYRPSFEKYGFCVIEGKTYLKGNYPENIAYNICRVGDFVIHNFKYTDEALLEFLNKEKIIKIQVSQGYTKCSIAVVNDKAIITSDIGIHREVLKFGIDSLLISTEGILLPGLSCGFIGGTCGYLNKKDLAFFGNPQHHKDYEKIRFFLKKYDKNIVALSNNQLQDYGTLVPLIEMD